MVYTYYFNIEILFIKFKKALLFIIVHGVVRIIGTVLHVNLKTLQTFIIIEIV